MSGDRERHPLWRAFVDLKRANDNFILNADAGTSTMADDIAVWMNTIKYWWARFRHGRDYCKRHGGNTSLPPLLIRGAKVMQGRDNRLYNVDPILQKAVLTCEDAHSLSQSRLTNRRRNESGVSAAIVSATDLTIKDSSGNAYQVAHGTAYLAVVLPALLVSGKPVIIARDGTTYAIVLSTPDPPIIQAADRHTYNWARNRLGVDIFRNRYDVQLLGTHATGDSRRATRDASC